MGRRCPGCLKHDSLPALTATTFLPVRDVAPAVAGEGLALPVAPALAQGHPGESRHEVQLGRPSVALRRRVGFKLAVYHPEMMGKRDLPRKVILLETQGYCQAANRLPGRT